MPEQTFRPNQAAFILWPLLTGTIGLGVFSFLLLVAAPFAGIHLFVAAFFLVPGFILLAGTSVVSRIVAARKTSFTFEGDRLLFRTGGILSSGTVELQLRNVTQAELRIPFVENRIFGTGEVTIASAGSDVSRVKLSHLDDPEAIHELLLRRMQESGFSLARERKLLDTRPSLPALAIREGAVILVGLVICTMILGVAIFAGGAAIMERLGIESVEEFTRFLTQGSTSDGVRSFQWRFTFFGAAAGALFLSLWTLVMIVMQSAVHFTRRYTVHEDAVEYETTLFGLNRVVIPIENLADVTTKQGPLGRIFRIADVELSCQGAARSISFPVLPEALRFRTLLRGLLEPEAPLDSVTAPEIPEAVGSEAGLTLPPEDSPAATLRADPLPSASRRAEAPPGPGIELRPWFRRAAAEAIWARTRSAAIPIALLATTPFTLRLVPVAGFDANYWLGYLPLALAVAGLLYALALMISLTGAWLHTSARRYEVGRSRLSATYTRISRTEVEFTFAQITSIVVERGIMDRLLGTATIRFRSIGSDQPLLFEHLRKGAAATAEILARLGAPDGEPHQVIRPHPSPSVYLRARAGKGALVLFLLGATLVAAISNPFVILAVPVILLVTAWHVALEIVELRYAYLEFHKDYLVGGRGVFRKRRHIAPLRQVKDVRSDRYPLSNSAALTWFAGGGARFSLPFVEEAVQVHDRMDALLLAHPQHGSTPLTLDTASVLLARPDVRAPLARTALLSLLVFPIGLPVILVLGAFVPPLLLATIPILFVIPPAIVVWAWIHLRRTRYELQESRILRERGVLRRSRLTIILDRIDHLSTAQGPLNKAFGTGSLSIYTTGSSMVELVLSDLRDHTSWLAPIEARLTRRKEPSIRAAAPGDLVEHAALGVGE